MKVYSADYAVTTLFVHDTFFFSLKMHIELIFCLFIQDYNFPESI